MALILVVQSELWDRIGLSVYAAICQRIDLNASCRVEARAYIAKHIACGGGEIYLQTASVTKAIASRAYPRLINKTCTHGLIYDAQNKHLIIDTQKIKRVVGGELS